MAAARHPSANKNRLLAPILAFVFHHSVSDARKSKDLLFLLLKCSITWSEVTYHFKTLTPNLPIIRCASMLYSQNLDFLQITITEWNITNIWSKRYKKESHSLKVQSICSHVGHCNSICSLLCEKTKEPKVGKMDISCLYYVDDLKLNDNSKPQPNKVWNILRNVPENMQIEFGIVICKSVGLAQGQFTNSLSENFRTSWVSLKGKSIQIDFF